MEKLSDKITAIVLAAGQGTRMKSARPKVLHEILGRPMIAYLLETLKAVGLEDVVMVVGYEAERSRKSTGITGCALWSRSPRMAPATRCRWSWPPICRRPPGRSWCSAAMRP